MKHLKMLGLALVAAAALMAFAGPASATTVTSPAGTEYTGEIYATATSSLLLQAGFSNATCTESTVKGKVESNGGAAASGNISFLSFSGCNFTLDVLSGGSLEVESTGENQWRFPLRPSVGDRHLSGHKPARTVCRLLVGLPDRGLSGTPIPRHRLASLME
jgi:hypothetical protein